MINHKIELIAACLFCAGIVACSENENNTDSVAGLAPIGFSSDVTTVTRANTTIDDTEALKKLPAGVGVFAYFTDTKKWKKATSVGKDAVDYPTPDFMYNQQVLWGIQRLEDTKPVYGWKYEPVKYWPNSSENKDPRYISFFAYAPWEADTEADKEYGIMEMPSNSNKTPHLKYKIGPVGNMTDLLYASTPNATRNINGLIKVVEKDGTKTNTYKNVPLQFKHALACVEVYIQRIYDEPHYSGKAPEEEKETKLFVSQLELVSSDKIFEEGYLNLETGKWTCPSSNDNNSTPKTSILLYTEDMLNDSISGTVKNGTTQSDLDIIADRELNNWEKTGFGINEKERCLFKEGNALFFIPQELTLTPTLSYSMVTRDNDLLLSDYKDIKENKYARIVHKVQGNLLKLNIQQGKRYKLLIHVEAEHVSFEVVSVTDWDFPLRFDTSIVQDFNEESKNHELNEN